MRRATSISLVVALAATGCADEPADEPAVGAEPWVALGQGLDAYTPIEDGDRVELVLGSQGGWHIDLGAEVGGDLGEDDIVLTFRVRERDGDGQVAYPIKSLVRPDRASRSPEGALQHTGVRLVFAIDDPVEVVGQPCLAEVELIVGPDVFVDDHEVLIVDER